MALNASVVTRHGIGSIRLPSSRIESVITFLSRIFIKIRSYRVHGVVELVETIRKRFLTTFRGASSRLDPCINLQWAWITQNPADLADLDFRQNRPAVTIDDYRRPMYPRGPRVSAVVHSQIGRGTTPCAITKSGRDSNFFLQPDDDRRFRDFAGQDTILNGMR